MADKTRLHEPHPQPQQEPSAQGPVSSQAPASVNHALQRRLGNRRLAQGGGRPLPGEAQSQLERAFNRDLSGLHVHTGSQDAAAARDLRAAAFTMGQDIYFDTNQYQPGTPSGDRLLAHETAHAVQQSAGGGAPALPEAHVTDPGEVVESQADRAASTIMAGGTVAPGALSPSAPGTIARQTAAAPAAPAGGGGGGGGAPAAGGGGGGAAPTAGAATVDPNSPPDEISLASATFEPTPAVDSYLESQRNRDGDVRVRLGNVAAGAIRVRRRARGETITFDTPGRSPQSIPLTIPALQPLVNAGVRPVLAVDINQNAITGYVTIASSRGAAGNPAALVNWIKDHTDEFGWAGIDVNRWPRATNELNAGTLTLQVNDFQFTLAGYVQGTGTFGLANEVVTFNASATIHVQGLTDAQINIERDEAGSLRGRAEVPVAIANFSGNLIAEYGNGTFNIEGMVGYQAEKFSGEVTLIVTDAATARQVALRRLGPEAIAASGEEAAGGGEEGAESAVPRPGPRAIAGWGVLSFALTEWLTGQAQVIIDNEGHLTIVGEIRPPAEIELFAQRDYIREIFTLEVRTLYGVPLVGNVFLFANVGLEALAKLGPAKIYDIVLQGTFSTDPQVLQNFSVAASLNISAFAGLRLRAEGGLGVELLDHDIKAGVGLNALAGVRGYVEARPTIGYRETASPEEGRQGEFYINGHMELAAQPFLGFSGDLFVELDSPWWSPAPDEKWTWPLGSLEYPLPGEFGIGADVDYVLGSDQLPEIQFGEVNFDSGKFMTDLMNDHVPTGSHGEQEQAGEFTEGETTGQGEVPPEVAPGAGAGAPTEPATGQQEPGTEPPPSPDVMQRWSQGMQALGALSEQSRNDPLNETELRSALNPIQQRYGFIELRPTRSGEDWRIHAKMNPEGDVTVEGEGAAQQAAPTAVQRPDWIPASATEEQVRRILALVERAQNLGAARGSTVNLAVIRAEIRNARDIETGISNLESALARGEREQVEQRTAVPGAAPESLTETPGVEETETQPFRTEQHHIFPQSRRPFFEDLRINIDRYVISIDRERHQEELHAGGMRDRMRGTTIPNLSRGGAFNQDWTDYFNQKERSGEQITRRGLYQKALNILRKYGLTNQRIHVYNNLDAETSLNEILA